MGREVLDRGAEVEERYACPRCGYMLKYVYYREWPCLSSAHLSCAHLPSFPLFLFPLK
jgi:lipopolysaccharide biosynthesis regulator YciM